MGSAVAAGSRPFVVELVGPAGAGKTTLAKVLPHLARDVRSGLNLWGLPRSFLLVGALGVMPTVAAVSRHRPLRGAAIGQMIRLGALRYALDRSAAAGARLIVLDEGPVFALTWLDVFHAREDDPTWRQWRQRTLRDWADRIDAVVRLDAEDRVLAHRIRQRQKPHPVKGSPDEEIFHFLGCFRRAFDRVIGELAATGSVRILELPPDADAPDEHAARLLDALTEVAGER
jgi:hypothetical protein